ncbi:TPA: hypothetical protein ACFOUB_001791 [Neisseria meningitidis]|nr:hypothetical protein [Neisseria meningitidis]
MPVFFKTAAQKNRAGNRLQTALGRDCNTRAGRQSLRQTTGTIRASDGFAVYGRGTIPAAIELANIASDKPHAQKNE